MPFISVGQCPLMVVYPCRFSDSVLFLNIRGPGCPKYGVASVPLNLVVNHRPFVYDTRGTAA